MFRGGYGTGEKIGESGLGVVSRYRRYSECIRSALECVECSGWVMNRREVLDW
jgi:hypothetical protein